VYQLPPFNNLSGTNNYELRTFNAGTFNGNINNNAVKFNVVNSSPITVARLNKGSSYTLVLRGPCSNNGIPLI